jgi:hypothetical protein
VPGCLLGSGIGLKQRPPPLSGSKATHDEQERLKQQQAGAA